VLALKSLLFVCALATAARAQNAGVRFPRLEDYRVTEIFHGKPAPPKLVRPADRLFRMQIREAAAEGPNFAGHYTIAQWGCGGGCLSIALVDAKDGAVHVAPFKVLGWGVPGLTYEGKYSSDQDQFQPLDFRLESSLLIVRGCPEEKNCASYFYEWTGSLFKLVQKAAAVGPVSGK
jgi:hypothetical protein